MLQEMFGEDSVPKIFKGEKLYVTVDGKKANIDLLNLVSTALISTDVCVTTHTLTPPEHDHATCCRRFAVKRMKHSSRLCRRP
jgi:cleavage and polyadenylation specificity factor subunit 3